MSSDDYKRQAAEAAIELLNPDMTIGLGTGSTAAWFIKALGKRVSEGFNVRGVPTSEETRHLAEEAGISLVIPDETTRIDLAVDGADEIDGSLNLIKGGGGAHLREKIVAQSAKEFVVIADASKKVAQLGAFPLPLEIAPSLWGLTVFAVRQVLDGLGYAKVDMSLRASREDAGVFKTDNGGYVLDCHLERIDDANTLDARLRAVPGVVETGLFLGMANRAITAGPDGVETLTR